MISTRTVFAAVPVADLDAAVAWWTTFVGRGPDHRPAPPVAEYYLSDARDPRRGTLQLIADTDRAGGGLATLNVAELRPLVDELADRGITIDDGIADLGRVLLATVTDPDGNRISLVQAPE